MGVHTITRMFVPAFAITLVCVPVALADEPSHSGVRADVLLVADDEICDPDPGDGDPGGGDPGGGRGGHGGGGWDGNGGDGSGVGYQHGSQVFV